MQSVNRSHCLIIILQNIIDNILEWAPVCTLFFTDNEFRCGLMFVWKNFCLFGQLTRCLISILISIMWTTNAIKLLGVDGCRLSNSPSAFLFSSCNYCHFSPFMTSWSLISKWTAFLKLVGKTHFTGLNFSFFERKKSNLGGGGAQIWKSLQLFCVFQKCIQIKKCDGFYEYESSGKKFCSKIFLLEIITWIWNVHQIKCNHFLHVWKGNTHKISKLTMSGP